MNFSKSLDKILVKNSLIKDNILKIYSDFEDSEETLKELSLLIDSNSINFKYGLPESNKNGLSIHFAYIIYNNMLQNEESVKWGLDIKPTGMSNYKNFFIYQQMNSEYINKFIENSVNVNGSIPVYVITEQEIPFKVNKIIDENLLYLHAGIEYWFETGYFPMLDSLKVPEEYKQADIDTLYRVQKVDKDIALAISKGMTYNSSSKEPYALFTMTLKDAKELKELMTITPSLSNDELIIYKYNPKIGDVFINIDKVQYDIFGNNDSGEYYPYEKSLLLHGNKDTLSISPEQLIRG